MMDTNKSDAYEALVQFLYRAPIGLVQTDLDGTVEISSDGDAYDVQRLGTQVVS